MSTAVSRPLRRFRRDTRAGAMVEFAIVAPVLFLLVFGVIDFGRAFFLYNNLTNAAREGARYAAVLPYTPASPPSTAVQTLVRSRINDPGASSATVTTGYSGSPAVVTVSIVNYPFNPVTFIAVKSARTLNVKAQFRVETQ